MTLLEGRIGGSATYARSLVAALRLRDDVEVQVISSASRGGGALATARWIATGANASAVATGADVLHCPAYLAPLRSTLPLVVTIHDLALGRMPEGHPLEWRLYYRFFVPALARRAARVITDTETTKREIVATLRVPSERVVAIPLGIDERFFGAPRPDRSAAGSPPLVVFPGPPIARKNLDLVLRVMAASPAGSALHQARLVITGAAGSDHPAYAATIERLGLGGRVRWTGTLAFDDLAQLYRDADLLVYPSFIEGFGLPPLEAMASGTPVVASNASCLPEVLGDSAVLVDPHDDQAFARAAETLLTDPEARQRVVKSGIARARAYTWTRCAAETVAAYRLAASLSNTA